ncbi:hypothetical protein FRC07_003785 [Ceratobasidium sp. 392]|nr:hypothetical protein FRC07_003785 [Ceratobasidium sp. 392]
MSTKSLEPHNDVRYSQATPLTNNSETDATYTAILKEAFEDPSLSSSDREEMKLILDTIVCTQEPLSVDLIVGLLRLDNEALVRSALRRLESVLQVSDMTDTVTGPKESFSDYLLDKLRSDVFYCDFRNHNTLLARRCFDQLRTPDPPFNICNLESSYLFDSDVPDLSIRIDKIVSKELFYACRYWESHLELAADSQDLGNMLLEFLSERFLLWMEVMSLKSP